MSPTEANSTLIALHGSVRAKLNFGDRSKFKRDATATVLGALIYEGQQYNGTHADRVSVADMLAVLDAVGAQLRSR